MPGPDCHAFFRHDTAHAGARTRTCAHESGLFAGCTLSENTLQILKI